MGSKKSVTIGYRYFMGIHMVICHGPVDSIRTIIAGDRVAWTGNVSANSTIQINQPELFGGEKKEGGIQGDVDVMLGGESQPANAYLNSQLGGNTPAFRGLLSLVLKRMYLTAMTPYIKPWAVRVVRIPGKDLDPATAAINSTSANGAHLLYEALTNQIWGMGYPTTALNLQTFRDAGQHLFNEGFGLSFMLTRQLSISELISEVLRHVTGVLYTNIETGLFEFHLIRGGYDINTLPVVDPSVISRLESFDRPSFVEMVNEVTVRYRPKNATTDESIAVHELASIQAQGGVVGQTVSYPGIDSAEIAARVAQRDLQVLSSPLARVSVSLTQAAPLLHPGDVVRFSWPDYQIESLAMRVTAIRGGTLQNGERRVEMAEDIFGLPQASYLTEQGGLWVDPVKEPVAIPTRSIRDLPYYEVATTFESGDLSAVTTMNSYVHVLAARPPVASSGFFTLVQPGSGAFEQNVDGSYNETGTVNAVVSKTQTTFTSTDYTGVGTPVNGAWAYLGNEIVRIDGYSFNSATSTHTFTVGRGCLDTVPETHAIGTRFWIPDDLVIYDPTDRLDGQVVNVKLLTQTGIGILTEPNAPADSLTLTGRQGRPYPPARFRVNGQIFPTSVITGDITLSWVTRNRLTQTAGVIDTETAAIATEPGVLYRVRVYGQTGTLIRTQLGITASGYTYTSAMELADAGSAQTQLTFRVDSYRDDSGSNTFSHQFQEHTVARV